MKRIDLLNILYRYDNNGSISYERYNMLVDDLLRYVLLEKLDTLKDKKK